MPFTLSLLRALCVSAVLLRADAGGFEPPPITVPHGYQVELVAGPPLVEHPMMACFDDQGRLFVAESAGLNLPREELEKELPNCVRMLEDSDGDGRFDRSTVFADRMTLPMGGLWLDGSLLVASPPYIWRLTDTDNDGRADRREVLVGQFGYTGNAASIHGPFRGPDGRIYWCDGRHGHRIQDASGEMRTEGQAARIFSCRPDGSDVEVVCGGGMDNPVEVDFTPEGEMLGTVNLFYRKRGDCLVNWVHGGAYPRYDQQGVVAELKRTGDLLPPVFDLGHVAVSGTVYLRNEGFFGSRPANPESLGVDSPEPAGAASDSGDNRVSVSYPFVVAEFNTHRVSCVWVERSGGGFTAKREEFLASTSADFHPTDVLEDADGSLLVIDTGGWFRIGCPTSQVAKPEILGAIYRVRRQDQTVPEDPRGRRLPWNGLSATELAARLDDPRPVVREQVIDRLARAGETSITALRQVLGGGTVTARRGAVWALCRAGSPAARELLISAVDDPCESVRIAAARSLSALRHAPPAARWAERLAHDTPAVRRELAAALGRCGAPDAVPLLFASLADAPGRMLEHAIIYAIIEIADPQATAVGLSDTNPAVQRAALIALEQMPSGGLSGAIVASLADSQDAPLRDTALEVLSRHPEWSVELESRIRDTLRQKHPDASGISLLRGGLVSLKWDEELQRLLAAAVSADDVSDALRRVLLEVLAVSRPQPRSSVLQDAVVESLWGDDDRIAQEALRVLTVWGDRSHSPPIERLARDAARSVGLRLSACESLARLGVPFDDHLMDFAASHCQGDVDPADRLTAARALADATLSDTQRRRVLELVAAAGPLELPLLIGAFEFHRSLSPHPDESPGDVPDAAVSHDARAPDRLTWGLALVRALEQSPAVESLSAERLAALFADYPQEVRGAAGELLKRLSPDDADQARKIAEIESRLVEGDAERGERQFFGAKAACGACHRVGTRGGDIGPDLSQIGRIRSRRDLLEAVVLPSASMARGFEAYQAITRQGTSLVGVIARDNPDSLVFRTGDRREVRLAREEIEELVPSRVSIMPQGLEQSLSPQDFSDLLAYLSRQGK